MNTNLVLQRPARAYVAVDDVIHIVDVLMVKAGISSQILGKTMRFTWEKYMENVVQTMPYTIPKHHHNWMVKKKTCKSHSQSWVVYGIVLTISYTMRKSKRGYNK